VPVVERKEVMGESRGLKEGTGSPASISPVSGSLMIWQARYSISVIAMGRRTVRHNKKMLLSCRVLERAAALGYFSPYLSVWTRARKGW
jgi:hypothetical protein